MKSNKKKQARQLLPKDHTCHGCRHYKNLEDVENRFLEKKDVTAGGACDIETDCNNGSGHEAAEGGEK